MWSSATPLTPKKESKLQNKDSLTCAPLHQSRTLPQLSSSLQKPPRTCSPCRRPPPHLPRRRARQCCSSEGRLSQSNKRETAQLDVTRRYWVSFV